MKSKRIRNSVSFYKKPLFLAFVIIVLGVLIRNILLNLRPFNNYPIPEITDFINSEIPEKPNIVVILLDDLDSTTTPFYEALPVTKALIKDRGLNFSNSFSPNPLCCPARASLLTGKYSHNTGVYNNDGKDGGWQKFYGNGNEEKTIAVYLKNKGYKTAHIGKYLNGLEDKPTHVPVGWTDWYGGVGRAIYTGYNYLLNENGTLIKYGSKTEDYLTDVIKNKAIKFINETEIGKPFLLSIAPTAPHYPLQPAPRHRNHPFKNASINKTMNYNETDLSDKPLWLQNSAATRSLLLSTVNIDYRQRMGSLYAVDEMIAEVLDALYKKGELENTYIIFTSDNGYNNGAHRLIQKMSPYDESQRVPLVISGPGINPGNEEKFALTIDLAPTILNLAGIEIPQDMDGVSLTPLLFRKEIDNWREDYIAEHKIGGLASEFQGYLWLLDLVTRFIDIPDYTALRSKDYLYIEWYPDGMENEYELYDLKNDPFQLNNLFNSKREAVTAETLDTLKSRLNTLKTCSGETCR